tara:strand:- start:176 stop:451 length:276 start_codon:yes stop_codon:yes gene_type:complete
MFMSRILLKGVNEAMGTSSANGSNFGNATLVRVINPADVNYLVTLTETVGGSTIGQFTLMAYEDIEIVKEPLNGIYAASTNVSGVPIGYTN